MSVRNRRRGGHFNRFPVNRGRSGGAYGTNEIGARTRKTFPPKPLTTTISMCRFSRRVFAHADRVHAATVRFSLVLGGGDGARAGSGGRRARTRRTTASPPPPPPLGWRSVASRKMWLSPCGSRRRRRRRRVLVVSRSAALLHPAAVLVAYRRDPVQTCRARARASCPS